MVIKRTYRRMNKAIRLAHSGEADSVLAAAHEILATRLMHGDALNSPAWPQDVKEEQMTASIGRQNHETLPRGRESLHAYLE